MLLLFLKTLTQLLCCEMWFSENLLTVKYEHFFLAGQQWDFVTSRLYLYSTSCVCSLVRQHSASRKCIPLHWAVWVALHFYDEDGKIRFVAYFFFSFLKLLLCFVDAYNWGILKNAWDKAEFSPLTSICNWLLDFFFQSLEGLLFKSWLLLKKKKKK